jgi:hypothetical protein
MPRVGFEPTIQILEQVKMVRVLDRAATVIGTENTTKCELKKSSLNNQTNLE